jgi:hypothetical protein
MLESEVPDSDLPGLLTLKFPFKLPGYMPSPLAIRRQLRTHLPTTIIVDQVEKMVTTFYLFASPIAFVLMLKAVMTARELHRKNPMVYASLSAYKHMIRGEFIRGAFKELDSCEQNKILEPSIRRIILPKLYNT